MDIDSKTMAMVISRLWKSLACFRRRTASGHGEHDDEDDRRRSQGASPFNDNSSLLEKLNALSPDSGVLSPASSEFERFPSPLLAIAHRLDPSVPPPAGT